MKFTTFRPHHLFDIRRVRLAILLLLTAGLLIACGGNAADEPEPTAAPAAQAAEPTPTDAPAPTEAPTETPEEEQPVSPLDQPISPLAQPESPLAQPESPLDTSGD